MEYLRSPLTALAPAVRLDDGTGNVINSVFPVTPDGNRIVFTVSTGDSRRAVHYSAPLHGGGATIALNKALCKTATTQILAHRTICCPPMASILFSNSTRERTARGNYSFDRSMETSPAKDLLACLWLAEVYRTVASRFRQTAIE